MRFFAKIEKFSTFGRIGEFGEERVLFEKDAFIFPKGIFNKVGERTLQSWFKLLRLSNFDTFYKILNGEINNRKSEQTKALGESLIKRLPHGYFTC